MRRRVQPSIIGRGSSTSRTAQQQTTCWLETCRPPMVPPMRSGRRSCPSTTSLPTIHLLRSVLLVFGSRPRLTDIPLVAKAVLCCGMDGSTPSLGHYHLPKLRALTSPDASPDRYTCRPSHHGVRLASAQKAAAEWHRRHRGVTPPSIRTVISCRRPKPLPTPAPIVHGPTLDSATSKPVRRVHRCPTASMAYDFTPPCRINPAMSFTP